MTGNLETRINRLEQWKDTGKQCQFIDATKYDTPKKVEQRKAEIIEAHGTPPAFIMALPGDMNL